MCATLSFSFLVVLISSPIPYLLPWKPHQCALEAAKFALEARGAPLPAIQRTKRERPESLERDRKRGKLRKVSSGRGERRTKQTVDKEAKALMVHRLPLGTTEQQLLHLMEKKTRVVAVKAQPIEFNSATGKSHVSIMIGNAECLV